MTAPLPKLFQLNVYRKDANGKFLWPGYGANVRILGWIMDRVSGRGSAIETPIGRVPGPGALNISGLGLAPDALAALLRVDAAEWRVELARAQAFLVSVKAPKALLEKGDELLARVNKS